MKLLLTLAGLISIIIASASASPSNRYTPTSAYGAENIAGFSLLVSPEAAKHESELQELRKELSVQLTSINESLPAVAIQKLRNTRIWVEWQVKEDSAAEFHLSKEWLSANYYNPEKYRSVEINNTSNFISWSQDNQPSMLLHELAHAYLASATEHNQHLVDLAFASAVKSRRYESVPYTDGKNVRAYALNSSNEYFSELTEAFFGRNDFYPFVRSDIEKHDPEGYNLMLLLWEVPTAVAESAKR
jgi:hypothetical protein